MKLWWVFRPTVAYISQTLRVTVTVAVGHEQESICDQSNGAISNDLE